MKTLPRMVIILIALNLIIAGSSFAQVEAAAVTPVQSSPEPVVTPDIKEERMMEDLLVNMPVPSSTNRVMFGGSSGTNSVFIVPNREIKAEELLTINEDMNVMSKIFGNELGQARMASARTNWVFAGDNWSSGFFGRGSGTPQGMYLQGYGALFWIRVDFPLSAGPQEPEQEEQETEEEGVDQVWQQTRQQIYAPQETGRRRRGAERQEEKYDPQKVENLKTSLIKALKHAANIRALKTDESVVLSITGKTISERIVSIQELPGTDQTIVIKESGGRKTTKVYTGGLPEDIRVSSPTVLVIRAKKSDIDAFATGDLDFAKFSQRVVILSYPLVSTSVGSSASVALPSTRGTGIR